MAAAAGYSPYLPEPIILRIQILLSHQKAAETTLISKSWLQAWSTRPIIDLDESHFRITHPSCTEYDRLTVFAKKTFRRYKHQSLRIHTFILSLTSEWYFRSGLATNWTSKALKLGATDFTFRFQRQHPNIVIPIHVVLGSENVVRRLCLEGACINRLKVVSCMGLKSLVLSNIVFLIDSFNDMISCCPLIENLSLYNVETPHYYHDYGSPMISLVNLTSLTLFLEEPKIQMLFMHNLSSSKFPNLKDLTLMLGLYNEKPYLISSGSLEILNLRADGNLCADLEIDAPKIRKFTFQGSVMPKFSYGSIKSSDLLESDVSLDSFGELSTTWFYKLSEFLSSMAGSKICLFLRLLPVHSFDIQAGDIERFSVCEMEDLTMDTRGLPTQSLYAFFDILFRICHPRMVTQYVCHPEDPLLSHLSKNDEILCQILEVGILGKGDLLPSRFKKRKTINYEQKICNDQASDMKIIKKLNVAQKICNEVWKAQQFDSVLEYSTSDYQQKIFRFQLKWKPS